MARTAKKYVIRFRTLYLAWDGIKYVWQRIMIGAAVFYEQDADAILSQHPSALDKEEVDDRYVAKLEDF